MTRLSSVDVSFHGEQGGDRAGVRLEGVGDVNGDGYGDFAVGRHWSAPTSGSWSSPPSAGTSPGQVYLLFGGSTGWPAEMSLADADVILEGETADDCFGSSFSGGGDVNGDGYDDILVGAPTRGGSPDTEQSGAVYLVLGRSGGWPSPFDMSLADVSFLGEERFDTVGGSVSVAPDLDGDGLDDLIIAGDESSEGANKAGQVYLVFGRASGWALEASLSTADASFWGEEARDMAGESVAGLGDVNGDGLGDLAIGGDCGAFECEHEGKLYLVFGRSEGWAMDTSLAHADASFLGEARNDQFAADHHLLAAVGDVNGDGLADLAAWMWKRRRSP